MILGFCTVILKNAQLDSAFDRIVQDTKILQSRLQPIDVEGRFNTLLLLIGDKPADYFKVHRKGPDDDVFQVTLGYDMSASYPRYQDDKVIMLIAQWLRSIFQETEGYATKREKLLKIVDGWQKETVERMVGERHTAAPTSGQ